MNNYHERLQRAIDLSPLSQTELADASGIAQSTVSSLCRKGQGSSRNATFALLLGVDAYWLETGKGDMSPSLDEGREAHFNHVKELLDASDDQRLSREQAHVIKIMGQLTKKRAMLIWEYAQYQLSLTRTEKSVVDINNDLDVNAL